METKNNVLIIKNRHPDGREASARCSGPPFAPDSGVNGQISARAGVPNRAAFARIGVGVGRRDLVFLFDGLRYS